MKSRQTVYRKRWRVNPVRLLMNIFLLLSLILFFHYFTRSITVQNREQESETFINIIIEKGDTLWSIARALHPNRDPRPVVAMIRDLNGLQENPTVFPGQILKIPAPARAIGKRGETATAFFRIVP
ncbi:MAG TPA: LysM peptidoglycan-binding domain-containing protein [Firmicutes bacterium]|jgi:hypothetical protein|nr:LysM peptidoglycan-binding domain-containing protein [Bacillota bacterium]